MEKQHIKNCFYALKSSINDYHLKKTKDNTLTKVFRDCQKLEYAIEGKVQSLLKMDLEDVQKITKDGDNTLEIFFTKKLISELDEPGAGPSPEMLRYIEKKNKKNTDRMSWLVAKGRLEIMKEELQRLEMVEKDLYLKVSGEKN